MENYFNQISYYSHSYLGVVLSAILVGVVFTSLLLLIKKYFSTASGAFRYSGWWLVLILVIAMPLVMSTDISRVLNNEQPPKITPESPSQLSADSFNQKKDDIISFEGSFKTYKHKLTLNDKDKNLASKNNIQDSNKSVELSSIINLLPVVLFFGWAFTVLFLFYRILSSYLFLYKLKKNSMLINLDNFPRLKKLIQEIDFKRKINICYSNNIKIPTAAGLGKPTVLIPRKLFNELDNEELEVIIIHEIAHLKRYDDWANLIQQLIKSVFFFNPAVHWISRQLDLEREIACDEFVISHTRDTDYYANCLTRLLRLTNGSGTLLMPGVLTGRKLIFKRFEALIMKKKTKLSKMKITGFVFSISLLSFILLQITPIFAYPGKNLNYRQVTDLYRTIIKKDKEDSKLTTDTNSKREQLSTSYGFRSIIKSPAISDSNESVGPNNSSNEGFIAGIAQSGNSNISYRSNRKRSKHDSFYWSDFGRNFKGLAIFNNDDDNYTKMAWSDGRERIGIILDGEIELGDDDRSIKSLSDNGYCSISAKKRSRTKEMEIEANRKGELTYTYYENGKEKEIDNEVEEWLGDIINDSIYKIGIGAEARVGKIYDKKGLDGVLTEIDKIDEESQYCRQIYYSALLNYADLSKDDYSKILKRLSYEFESDYTKASLLIDISDAITDDPVILKDYFNVVRTIDSDYETRRVLSELYLTNETDPAVYTEILNLAEYIESDYEKAELLIDISDACEDNAKLRELYLSNVKNIDSDYEKRRVIDRIGKNHLDRDNINEILLLSSEINSDYEKASLLIELAGEVDPDDVELLKLLIERAADLSSNYETKRVLTSFSLDCQEHEELILAELRIISRISSDYEKGQILDNLSDCAAENPTVMKEYISVVEEFSSDYEKTNALEDIINHRNFNDEMVLAVIEVTRSITSDFDKAKILKKLIKYCPGNDEFENAMYDAIDTIESAYESKSLYKKMRSSCGNSKSAP